MTACYYNLYLGTKLVGRADTVTDAWLFRVSNHFAAVYCVYSDGSSVRVW